MYIFPIHHTINTFLDGDAINVLSVGVQDLPNVDLYLENCRQSLDANGLFHVQIRTENDTNAGVLLIEDRYIYWVGIGNLSREKSSEWVQSHQNWVGPVMRWCDKNCQGSHYIDTDGIKFSLLDDYFLFKLRFAGSDIFPKFPHLFRLRVG